MLELSGTELREIRASHTQPAAAFLLTPLRRGRDGTATLRTGHGTVEEKVYYSIIEEVKITKMLSVKY